MYAPSKGSSISVWHNEEGDRALLFAGTNHTFSQSDLQIVDLERFFKQFRPTLVLLEGGDWPVARSGSDAVTTLGEIGLVRYLAAMHSVRVESVEPPFALEVEALLKQFDATELKFFYAVRQIPQLLREKSTESLTSRMTRFLSSAELRNAKGILVYPANVDDLNQLVKARYPTYANWQELDAWREKESPLHASSGDPLSKIRAASDRFRNGEMEAKIKLARSQNQRLMVVTGVGHLAKLMPRLATQ